MRFLADQDIYQTTADFLRELGHDLIRARDIGLSRASDDDLLKYAHHEGRILLTRDKGFGALIFLLREECNGVILLKVDPRTTEAIHQELARFLEEHVDSDLRNCFVVVEPHRHRIRTAHKS